MNCIQFAECYHHKDHWTGKKNLVYQDDHDDHDDVNDDDLVYQDDHDDNDDDLVYQDDLGEAEVVAGVS